MMKEKTFKTNENTASHELKAQLQRPEFRHALDQLSRESSAFNRLHNDVIKENQQFMQDSNKLLDGFFKGLDSPEEMAIATLIAIIIMTMELLKEALKRILNGDNERMRAIHDIGEEVDKAESKIEQLKGKIAANINDNPEKAQKYFGQLISQVRYASERIQTGLKWDNTGTINFDRLLSRGSAKSQIEKMCKTMETTVQEVVEKRYHFGNRDKTPKLEAPEH